MAATHCKSVLTRGRDAHTVHMKPESEIHTELGNIERWFIRAPALTGVRVVNNVPDDIKTLRTGKAFRSSPKTEIHDILQRTSVLRIQLV